MSRFLATHSKGLPMVHDGLPRTKKKCSSFFVFRELVVFQEASLLASWGPWSSVAQCCGGVWVCLWASQLPFSLQVTGQCRSSRGFCQVVNSTNENLEVFLIRNKIFYLFIQKYQPPRPIFKETITTKRQTFQSYFCLSLAGLICSSAAKCVHVPVKVSVYCYWSIY